MNSKYISFCIGSLLFLTIFMVSAEPNQTLEDSSDDVVFMDLLSDYDEWELTDEKPNVDILKITYNHPDESNEVTVIMEVKGSIEDRNDFENIDINDTDFFGSIISYFIELETSYNEYVIEYTNRSCVVNGKNTSFTVDGSELSITFNLSTSNESFVYIEGYTTEIIIISLSNIKVYMDAAPNELLFFSSITAPYEGQVCEPILFTGSYEDMMGVSKGPYVYTWDFNDGSSIETGSTVSHTFQYPGTYNVELTIEDSTGLTTSTTHLITIIERENIYDVNFDDIVDFKDVFLVWKHRRDEPIDPLYDVNSDDNINFEDMWLVWKNRG